MVKWFRFVLCWWQWLHFLWNENWIECLNKWNERFTKKSAFMSAMVIWWIKVRQIWYMLLYTICKIRIQEIIKCAFNSNCVVALNAKSLFRFLVFLCWLLIKFTFFIQAFIISLFFSFYGTDIYRLMRPHNFPLILCLLFNDSFDNTFIPFAF